jgi:hypothetical protein
MSYMKPYLGKSVLKVFKGYLSKSNFDNVDFRVRGVLPIIILFAIIYVCSIFA